MTTPNPERREHPSTYFVQDRSNQEEMNRLQILDHQLTAGMGGMLPEQTDPTIFHRVLDVGCGTGGWLIELAREYPSMIELAGVDVSKTMVDYAREQASQEGVSDRVTFHVMDALRMLEFPTEHFDLVNHRMNFSYLRTWDWAKLLSEDKRVCRVGGIIRLTESNVLGKSTSPALTQLYKLAVTAFYNGGYLFENDCESIPRALQTIMTQQGIQNVQTREISFVYHSHDSNFHEFYGNTSRFFRTMLPFLRKWTRVPTNYDDLYKQALTEMQQPEFTANWRLVTAWGTCPVRREKVIYRDGE